MVEKSIRRAGRGLTPLGAAFMLALIALPLVGAQSAGASTNLLSNGDFEGSGSGSLAGWSKANATLTLAGDGVSGVNAALVAYSGTGATYSLKSSPQLVTAVQGTAYTADGMVRSGTPGKSVCLKIVESGTLSGNAIACAAAGAAWASLPEITYTAKANGDKLVLWVTQKAAASGNSFEADALSLSTPGGGGLVAPTNLRATTVATNEVDLAWDASPAASSYTLYRGPTCGSVILLASALTATTYPDQSVQPSNSYAYSVDLVDSTGTHSPPSPCIVVTTPGGTISGPVIAAVGDISCDPLDPNFNSGNGQHKKCAENATAALVAAGSYAAVLPLGDLQYDCASLSNFTASYDLAWGQFSAAAYPVLGNHEYGGTEPGCNTSATGYFDYFAQYANPNAPGVNGLGYYSYPLDSWHVIALNSNCAFLPKGTAKDGCAVGSPQETWLKSDLASPAAQTTCTLAFWHHAPWSSQGKSQGVGAMRPMWADLANAGVDLALVGHFHHYERFADMNASGVAVPNGTGMRELVVGTGGEGLGGFNATPFPASQVRDHSTFGIASITLGTGTYSWNFIPAAPGTFTDVGSDTCHS